MSEAESLRRQESRGFRRRLELFYINYAAFVYFLLFEAALAVTAIVLGLIGTGSTTTQLRTTVDIYTAWSGVFGGLTIFFGLTMGTGLVLWYVWDFIDAYR